jgi:hypothetical protein
MARAATCTRMGVPSARRLLAAAEDALPLVARAVALQERDARPRDRAPRPAPSRARRRTRGRSAPAPIVHVEVAHGLEHAVREALERAAIPVSSRDRRLRAGVALPSFRSVVVRAPRGEAGRAGRERLPQQRASPRCPRPSRRGPARHARAPHHVHPQRVVRHLEREVDRVGHRVERRRVFREALPPPAGCPPRAPIPGCPPRPPSAGSAPSRGRPARTGAKPTPQLPITHGRHAVERGGGQLASQLTCPS